MICERCGHSMPDGSLTCERCGTFLGKYSGHAFSETGVRAIRQGRVSASSPTLPAARQGGMKEYGDYDLSALPIEQADHARRRKPVQPEQARKSTASRPDTRRGVPVNTHGRAPAVPRKHGRIHNVKRRNVNWMLIGLICAVLVMLGAAGYMVYMSKSDTGQRATARRNTLAATEGMFTLALNDKDPLVLEEREALLKSWMKAPAQAYWLVGQEYLDVGDVETSIISFRIADILDPENYDGLLLLANAYELLGDDASAEAMYLNLEENISPFLSEAYTALIRMYQEQDRGPEAADMMLLAYTNTDKETFRLQRKDYIPLMPQISLAAGRYEISALEEDIFLTSPQGYDIYYTVDDAVELPEGGKLAQDGKIIPEEGTVTLRAVCVSGDLVSDPLSVSYTFYYPSPPAPKANLAPNTYDKPKEVSLRPGEMDEKMTKKEKEEAEAQLVYYYTIDGSIPTVESPVYDGTPIKMPSGRVTLRAICVNQYGKMSSTMEVGYKFNIKPSPLEMYQEADTFKGFTLNKTTQAEFVEQFGQPKSEVETTYLNMNKEARHLEYRWGYAVFILEGNAWQLVRIEMNSEIAAGPRGVGFGSSESEVTGAYKDFGQKEAPNGTRGLYYEYPTVGQVLVNADGTRMVQYSCSTLESKIWVLQYYLSNGRVNKIVHYYQP